jgi:2,3-bisphosphoglycerate-dependent phosphoglycerate mutase
LRGKQLDMRTAATSGHHPSVLWLVRHGESAGNVARAEAERRGSMHIEITGRDVDVGLSPLGERQARAVGSWFARQPDSDRFTVVLSSPFLRARRTAELIVAGASRPARTQIVIDERLREKEFGSLNRLTASGIRSVFPAEDERREVLGKFYYRPPGGESWCDVILRLRTLLDHIQLRYSGERVLLVAHQVIVLCFRYLLENLDEQGILAIDSMGDVGNCSLTIFESAHDEEGRERMELRAYNLEAPLEQAGAEVTNEPDPAVKA